MAGCLLLSLSLELILAICDELELIHLKQLRLTCKVLASTLAAPVLRRLSLSAKWSSLKLTVRNLDCLTEATSASAQATRELKIDNLSKIAYRYLAMKGGKSLQQSCKHAGENITSQDESNIRRGIFSAITSLQAVTTLTWCSYSTDPPWLQVVIWRSIKALPNLRYLTIDGFFLKCPLDLHTLTKLESISICGTPRTGADQLFRSLARLCASSLRLTSLTISHTGVIKARINNLHHLFSMCNNKSPPLRLRHLGLSSCLVKLDKVTLPHLKHLTSLSLDLSFVDMNSTAVGVASSSDAIWKTLTGSGIHLEELKFKYDYIPISLIDYLSSYSGLKKLRLTLTVRGHQASSCEAAASFFSKGLVNHFDTLEALVLVARFQSLWNFCSSNSTTIAKCSKLKYLAMNVFLELDAEETGSINWNLPDDNIVKQFLDIATGHLPHVQRLVLAGARPENITPFSFPPLHYDAARTDDIKKCIRSYVAQASCQYLPPVTVFFAQLYLSVSPTTFISTRDTGNGGRLMYVERMVGSQTRE